MELKIVLVSVVLLGCVLLFSVLNLLLSYDVPLPSQQSVWHGYFALINSSLNFLYARRDEPLGLTRYKLTISPFYGRYAGVQNESLDANGSIATDQPQDAAVDLSSANRFGSLLEGLDFVTQNLDLTPRDHVEKRARKVVTWDVAVCRGTQLLNKLQNRQLTPTAFGAYSALADFKYSLQGPAPKGPGYFGSALDTAYAAFNLPGGATWQRWTAATTAASAAAGIQGSCTFTMAFEPSRASAITFLDVHSPETPQPNALTRLSDVAFLGWDNFWRSAGMMSPSLNYIFSNAITNVYTVPIMNRAWQSAGAQPGAWPGITFQMNTQVGKALLGTPNGIAAAWLLINHGSAFQSRTVKSITIFKNGLGEPAMLVTLGPL